MKLSNIFYRAGVGVIIHQDGKVAFFERSNEPGHWQFPQGGMYTGESPIDAMWRELQEETGLTASEVSDVHEVPFLVSYTYPRGLVESFNQSEMNYVGQTQKWFILKLENDVVIDISAASDGELRDKKWITPEDTLSEIIDFKQQPYEQLIEYFKKHIS